MSFSKPSGAEFRKRAAERQQREEEVLKKVNKITGFFNVVPKIQQPPELSSSTINESITLESQCFDPATSDTECTDVLPSSSNIKTQENIDDPSVCIVDDCKNNKNAKNAVFNNLPDEQDEDKRGADICDITTEECSPFNETEKEPVEEYRTIVSHDPGEWPAHITDNIRQILVHRGPEQVTKASFPVNNDGRRFSTKNYHRRHCNGEEIPRTWLVYSTSKDKIFCFCCRLFGKVQNLLACEAGYNDWKHMSTHLSEHEKTNVHMSAFKAWTECNERIQLERSIDAEHLRIIKNETERWREVFKRIILLIQFLASQNLALRGKNDTLFTRNNGNFLKLIEFVGKFDAVIAEHLRKITSKDTHVHYLGKNIQNEIIEILGRMIKEQILKELKASTYYSVILDCTPDNSHTEQLSLIIRYVSHCGSVEEPKVEERFLGFIPVDCSTGEALTETLLAELGKCGLNVQHMRGQGYDNGSNMRGKHVGVQTRILNINPRAFFVPCSAHSLNLVINDAALSSLDAVNFFGILQELYNFFSSSNHRWAVLKKNVPVLTVKPLSETRWESRIDAVTPLRYHIGEIYDALFELSNDDRVDAKAKNIALGLAKKLKNFKFCCCVVIWHMLLFRTNIVSKVLQKEDIDLGEATKIIEKAYEYFQSMRSDESFQSLLVDAREVAETLEVEPVFPLEVAVRKRKVKRQFDHESRDEAVTDPKEAFKISFYFFILDQTITSIEERFSQLKHHNETFGFLYALEHCSTSSDELMKKCGDLQNTLTDGTHRDVEGFQLFQELSILTTMLPNDVKNPLEILRYLTKNRLNENFPNVCVAIRIALTLPVTVASAERSFSKLKLIKNYLRSTMSQERLVGLSFMSIEFDVLENLDLDLIMKDFAERKARKVNI